MLGGRLRSCHTLEIPFVFDTLDTAALTGDDPARLALGETMSRAWIAFARGGRPDHAGCRPGRPIASTGDRRWCSMTTAASRTIPFGARAAGLGGNAMKITDVSLTLFAWDDIPPTQYGLHSKFAGSSALGLLRIAHRRRRRGPRLPGFGLELGDDRRAGADHPSQADADGQDPLHREALVADLWKQAARLRRARDRRGRRRAVGPRGQGDGPADPSPARHLSRIGAGLCQLGGAAVGRGLRRGGDRLQGIRLGRLQDPSADRWQRGHQGLRAVRKRRRRLHHHARLDLGLRLSGGGEGRPRRRGAGLPLVRGPARTTRTSTTTSS